jgi:hypothetical protein
MVKWHSRGLSVQVDELSLTSIAEVVTFVERVSRQDFGSQDGSVLIRWTFQQFLVVRDLRRAQRKPECARYDCEHR